MVETIPTIITMVGITLMCKINLHGYHDRTDNGTLVLITAAYQQIMQKPKNLFRPILSDWAVILKTTKITIIMMKLIVIINILKMRI